MKLNFSVPIIPFVGVSFSDPPNRLTDRFTDSWQKKKLAPHRLIVQFKLSEYIHEACRRSSNLCTAGQNCPFVHFGVLGGKKQQAVTRGQSLFASGSSFSLKTQLLISEIESSDFSLSLLRDFPSIY